MNNTSGLGGGRGRRSLSSKGRKSMKLNQSFGDRVRSKKLSRQTAKATYLSTLPKDRWKRLAYRLHPKRVAAYWFSREGAIMALKIIGVGIVACFFLTIGLFAYFRKDLPKLRDISGQQLGGSITYYDRTGQTVLWQDYNAVKRIPVTSDNISPYMKEATVAIEDKDFYKHGAFDVRGIIRAAAHDVVGGGGSVQGGSTITQQLVKLNEQWTNNRTITRKVKELILAVELEREYSKNDILTGYLNVAPYGGVEYGVESASRDYFGISAKDLNLAQASLLAAMPQSPSYYSPYGSTQFNSSASGTFNQTALLNRQHYILDQMVKQHYITQDQANQAKQENIMAEIHPLTSKYNGIKAPYFVLAAKQQLEQQYGSQTVERGGWKVVTTLDVNLQNYAEQDVKNNVNRVKAVGGDEQAMVAEDVKTGQIVAEVGGEDFNDPDHGQINYAHTKVSPGSSLKPFVYAALIQNNTIAGAGSVLYDSLQTPPNALPGYPCTDQTRPSTTSNGGNCLWDDNFIFPGPETIRYALGGSRNVPAVKASYEIVPGDTSNGYLKSINKWISMTNEAIGIDKAYGCYPAGTDLGKATPADQSQCFGAAAIGAGAISIDEEVNGDATFARMGQTIPKTYILSITDAANKTVYKWQQPKPKQVFHPDTAYIVNNMLADPKASYLNVAQKFQNYNGWDIAIKTGTENSAFNGVMTAWSTQYAVIGFAGYHTLNKPLKAGHFEDITEPITRTWMQQALDALHTKPVNWDQPSDIKSIPAYVQRTSSGFGQQVPGPTNELFPSWYNGNAKSATQTIDKVSGGVATSCTPDGAKETVGGANDNSFSIDMFYPSKHSITTNSNTGSSTAAQDTVHNCSDSPPSIHINTTTCDASSGTSCSLSATPFAGTHPLNDPNYPNLPGTVTISVNGTQVCSVNNISDGVPVSCDYSPSFTGSGTVTATVTDSVLYSGSDSATVNFTQAPAQGQTQGQGGNQSQTLTLSLGSHTGNSANFSWSDIGASTYTLCWSGPTTGCGSFSTTSGTATGLKSGGHYTAVVTANGKTSNTVTWTQ